MVAYKLWPRSESSWTFARDSKWEEEASDTKQQQQQSKALSLVVSIVKLASVATAACESSRAVKKAQVLCLRPTMIFARSFSYCLLCIA